VAIGPAPTDALNEPLSIVDGNPVAGCRVAAHVKFSVTYDYRCPFAHLAHDEVLAGLAGGADWEVTFVPFSLGQVHVEAGQPDIWETPQSDTGLLALQVSVVVRDRHPDAFLAVHRDLFDLRHIEGRALAGAEVREVLERHGIDADTVLDEVAGGGPLTTVRAEHEAAVEANDVWGVPTFIAGGRAAFVRLMESSPTDHDARIAIERVVELVGGWPALNELKHTTLDR